MVGHMELWQVAGLMVAFAAYEVGRFTLCPLISRLLFPKTYPALDLVHTRMWLSRIVSNLHVAASMTLAIASLLAELPQWQGCNGNGWDCGSYVVATSRTSFIAAVALLNTSGYFLSDTLDLARTRWGLGDISDSGVLIFGHHIFGTGACMLMLAYDRGALIGMVWLLTELSTPFANALWFFTKSNQKQARRVSGICLLVGFLMVRIPISPLTAYYMLVKHRDLYEEHLPAPLWWYQIFSLVFATFMNYFWFYRIVLGTLKSLGLTKKKVADSSEVGYDLPAEQGLPIFNKVAL